ncbi:class I SAM-dependent methyltransferase [Lapillicoccus sp.]|uniref:class I SAM-dependent methyltransferase n=1 Tax=Lapillicoccus sp. TaxID=1909287 RepID=UPI003263CF02
MTTFISPELHSGLDTSHWPDLGRMPGALKRNVHARVARRLFDSVVARLDVRVELPDGTVVGRAAHVPSAPVMVLHHPDRFISRLGAAGLIGFGESYMAGDWDSPDLGRVLSVFAERMANLVPQPLQKLRALYVARHPSSEINTTKNTRSNISRHYDLSNEMFEQFLDPTMSYSSALFDNAVSVRPSWDDLAPAQDRKIDRLLDGAGVGEGSRVLEIGTGWGELAIRAARRGAIVRSVTLSQEQQVLAQRRVREAGFEDSVTVDLLDYRAVDGQYDAIVSVEMIEAVGYDYWPTYFETIDQHLAPGGKVAIQAITMPHDRMLATRNTYTWVHKYIFPGGFLPSTEAIDQVTRAHTTLRVADRLSMGQSYAQTLRLWDERFASHAAEVGRLGFDAVFRRMWHFYLEYSRAGFTSGYLDVQQFVLQREDNR